jgi:hypothetical protein
MNGVHYSVICQKYGMLGDGTIGIATTISYFLAAPHTQDRLETLPRAFPNLI